MSALHQLAESLARLEHKVDILLREERKKNPMLMIPAVGDFNHQCPVCQQPVSYIVDTLAQVLVRKCGCKTGLQAPINLEAFAPPTTGGKRNERNQDEYNDPEPSGGHRSRLPGAGRR